MSLKKLVKGICYQGGYFLWGHAFSNNILALTPYIRSNNTLSHNSTFFQGI